MSGRPRHETVRISQTRIFLLFKYLHLEEEWKAEGITKVMLLKMIKLSNRKVFNNKVSFNIQTCYFSVLPCQWIAKEQRVTSRYKPGMYSTHREVKRQAQVKTICSATPYDWGWGVSSLGFKKEDRRRHSRSLYQWSCCFFQDCLPVWVISSGSLHASTIHILILL